MATSDPNTSGGNPTRGSGDDKVTQAVDPDLDAAPNAQANEPPGSNAADPGRGGCMGFGWGCLPLAAFLLVVPPGLLLF